MLAADGVDGGELQAVRSFLEGMGLRIEVVAPVLGSVTGANGASVPVDRTFLTTASVMYDAVYVPGGAQSADTLKGLGAALHFVNEAFAHFKPIGALGDGAGFLAASDIGRVLPPGQDVPSRLNAIPGVIASDNPSGAQPFGARLADAIGQHRFWARSQQAQVPA